MRSESSILSEIAAFSPTNGNWIQLDSLLNELWECQPKIEWVKPLLEVFDKHPAEDGAGVFWAIVHGLETIDGYEPLLLESARAKPHEFKSILLNRAGIDAQQGDSAGTP